MRMMSRPTVLFTRAKQILQTEGLIPLVRQASAFVVRRSFSCGTSYLYEYATENVPKLDEADFMPKIDDFTFKIISTNHEADELEPEGLEFRLYVLNARERLDKGAVAFCVFVEGQLAHISWVGMTQEAKDALSEPPYKVDFSNGEVFTGGAWTSPQYRRKGLSDYSGFQIRQFLCESGIAVVRGAVRTDNVAGQRSFTRLGRRWYAETRYLKILWWKSWKEKPLTAPSAQSLRD